MAVLKTPTFNQLSTVLTSIVNQATGKTNIAATDTSSFVSLATTALETGTDPLMNAISTVLGKTIFSTRPYSAKFKGLKMSEQRYGSHVRKLQLSDKAWEEDDRIKLADGSAIDQYIVNKPSVLQTNFYGQNVYQKSLTIFKDQLDVAFKGPDEFGQFVSMVMTNASDMIEQAHESTARMALGNFMGAKIKADANNVVYLVSEYNTATGKTLTATTVKDPDNWPDFCRWLFGYLQTLSDRLTDRTTAYHMNFTGHDIMRHTPRNKQKCYLYGPMFNDVDSRVLSNTFNDQYLKVIDNEKVNFWQSSKDPMKLQVTASYNNATGGVTSGAVTQDKILGIIFDEEAVGYCTVNQWSAPTPLNAKGGYSNIFYHFTDRYFNDLTENAVLLVLDTTPTA